MYISFSPSPSLPWEKKYSLLSLIPPCPTQAMRSDRLHISCSAPASESWTDGQHQDGGAAKSGRWAWYPQVCLAAAEEHRVNFPCARLQAEPFTVVGLVTNLSAQQPLQKFSPAAEAGIWFAGSEEERQGAGSLPPILMEQEGTQAVFLGGLGFSAPWIKTTDLPKTEDGKRENSASLQLLERSKERVS